MQTEVVLRMECRKGLVIYTAGLKREWDQRVKRRKSQRASGGEDENGSELV